MALNNNIENPYKKQKTVESECQGENYPYNNMGY